MSRRQRSNNPYLWLAGCGLGAAFLVVLEVSHGFSLFDLVGWSILLFAFVTRALLPLRER
jgi:hypothetical protein